MSEFQEFDRLLSRYFEGELTEQELQALESQLLASDAFAEHFSRWCLMHRQVAELLTEDTLHALMDQFVTGSPALPKNLVARGAAKIDRVLATERGLPGARRWTWASVAAAAVGVAAVALMAAVWLRGGTEANRVANAAAEAAPSSQRIIATLTRLVDGVWQPGAEVLHYGQQLHAGARIALASGMAKVTFECGAEVVLEGPCDFEIRSAMAGVLNSGKLTADVPRRAFAFAIFSPGVDFVDLGTSFGISADPSGRTELHVFEGEVLCSQPNDEGQPRNELLHVTAQTAMEFDASGGNPNHIAMDQQQFSRLIAMRHAADVRPQRWAQNRLTLWLAADMAVTTDDANRVVSWRDILYGDNESAEDALQSVEDARPLLVSDAINGRPAIRFDGNSDFLLTTPLETTDDQTVLFVCQFSPSAFDEGRLWGGQILNYDGPDRVPEDVKSDFDLAERTRFLSNTLVPGVLQIGEPLLETEFKPTMLTGQVFAGFIGSAVVEAGRIDAEPVGANVPVVVSYLYDYGGGKSRLAVNGRVYGEARAFAPQGITSRKIIGRHAWKQLYFHGDLAELLIFNKALTPEELADTTAYLAEKYSIQIEPATLAAKPGE